MSAVITGVATAQVLYICLPRTCSDVCTTIKDGGIITFVPINLYFRQSYLLAVGGYMSISEHKWLKKILVFIRILNGRPMTFN